jgi:glycine betaine/proline transport system substrate-binding protein
MALSVVFIIPAPASIPTISEEIHAIAWKGFSEKDPFAAEFFGNIKLTTEELSSFMTAMKDARMDEEEIARKWRDEHRQLVDSWIPKSENK